MSKKFLTPPNLPHGTTLPGAGLVGDLFYKSDEGLVYSYNGTSWTALNAIDPLNFDSANQTLTINSSSDDIANYVVQRDADGVSSLGGLALDPTNPAPLSVGMFTWNADQETADLQLNNNVTLQVGQEHLIRVKNASNSVAIQDGTVVMFAGATGDTIKVAPAISDGTVSVNYFAGIATEPISADGFGFVTQLGFINHIDTSAWPVGTILYPDPFNPGELTDVAPTAPAWVMPVAAVTKQSASAGRMLVRAIPGGGSTGGGASVVTAELPPDNPNVGDMWYDTSDGTLYVYYDDGDSTQWVELQTNTATAVTQEMPAGSIVQWSGTTAPANWLMCDGSAVSRTTYHSLFNVIGETYGVGDGTTTFNLPDLRGRVAVGLGTDPAVNALGYSGGRYTLPGDGLGTKTGLGLMYGSSMDQTTVSQSNMPPYLVTNYIIKYSVGASSDDSQLAGRVGALEASDVVADSRLDSVESINSTQNSRLTSAEANISSLGTSVTSLGTSVTALEARKLSGLVPIIPTSVTVSSGTVSTSSTGEVTVTNASDIILNNIFSSSFKFYKILFSMNSGNTPDHVYSRFTSGGVANSSTSYRYATLYVQAQGSGTWPSSGNNNWMITGYAHDFVFEVFNPYLSLETTMHTNCSYQYTRGIGQAGFYGTNSFDGMQFSGNFYTGVFRIYGYN